jgi:hypothetical protein
MKTSTGCAKTPTIKLQHNYFLGRANMSPIFVYVIESTAENLLVAIVDDDASM